jgi:large subunit ribosomal protein L24
MQKIKKGDMVRVIAGNHIGKEGKVLKVLKDKNRALVEKVNLIKVHSKPSQQNQTGGIIEKEGSIHISNLKLICPASNKPSRVGFKRLEDGRKVRVAKVSGEIIDK